MSTSVKLSPTLKKLSICVWPCARAVGEGRGRGVRAVGKGAGARAGVMTHRVLGGLDQAAPLQEGVYERRLAAVAAPNEADLSVGTPVKAGNVDT